MTIEVTRIVTDSCGNVASFTAPEFTFGVSTELDDITDPYAPLTATEIFTDGCDPLARVVWLIEDVTFEDTAFPVTVALFGGVPTTNAQGRTEVLSGTYNSPIIDWATLGLTSGTFRITRTVTDSCGNTASSESNNFTL